MEPHHNVNIFIHNSSTNLISLLTSKTTPYRSSQISMPILFNDSPPNNPPPTLSPSDSTHSNSLKPGPSGSNVPSTVHISGLNTAGKVGGGGPAFVGQVFSMCDLSGTGLMAVSTHFDIPFISKRTPEWIKKIFATATNSQRNSPVFRFFMDIGDAVSYVKKLNIPSGVVGACRLDLAYEHFKEKPHLFQFVPNEKQVKEANKILKTRSQNDGRIRIDGVPVFSAQNLDIAIATTDGVKWYAPYFFDKNMLDNILEDSVDQHFQSLIHSRHMQRRRDVIDDNMGGDMPEESGESLWEPPEVQEVLDEVGHPGIPLSVISKAAEIQLLYAVDNVLLGNRWLRKATGIQPKFPYKVDTFEKRSAASLLKGSTSTSCIANSETEHENTNSQLLVTSESNHKADLQTDQGQKQGFWFPFGDWFSYPLSKQSGKSDTRDCVQQEFRQSPLLPRITMVGISTSEAGQMSKATLKKTMDDLTRELEQTDNEYSVDTTSSTYGNTFRIEERDPLFVANVGEIYPGVAKKGSARFVRGVNS